MHFKHFHDHEIYIQLFVLLRMQMLCCNPSNSCFISFAEKTMHPFLEFARMQLQIAKRAEAHKYLSMICRSFDTKAYKIETTYYRCFLDAKTHTGAS